MPHSLFRQLLLLACFLVAPAVAGAPAAPAAAVADYQIDSPLNTPAAWQPPDPVTLANPVDGMLALTFGNLKVDESRFLALRQPLPLDPAVKAVNYWTCFPAAPEEFGVSLTPAFADREGHAISGSEVQFLSSHIGTANGRKSGLWFYQTEERNPKAVTFTGFTIHVYYTGSAVPPERPHTIFLKDIGLERLDYAKAPLYYVVGNYRDNFDCTAFNGGHARALTDATGGSPTPYVLLDNLLDTAKTGRPDQLSLDYFVYDIRDRLVHTGRLDNVAAGGPPDFFREIPIPITTPGTYNIKGKSYNSATGEYFTTDWTKLIVLKGAVRALNPVANAGPLAINPDSPYGALEKTDRRLITFQIGPLQAADRPAELRYTLIPYDVGTHGWDPVRTCTLDHTLAVTKSGSLSVPYEPRHTVELIVAELWQGNRRVDHEERPIGIRNELDRAPTFVKDAAIPSLPELAGPGKNWMNIQFHTNPGQSIPDALARNIDEAKKLTPNLGFFLDLKRAEPLPGVYDWDYLTPLFDLAAQKGCRVIPYMALKWPVDWAPIEFQEDSAGCAHRVGTMWGYMVGKYLYPNGDHAPAIIHDFLAQLARRYLNHPGFGGYYLENEHIDTQWLPMPVSRSYHEGYRQRFAEFVEGRYGSLPKLNQAYGSHFISFNSIQLPDPALKPTRTALVDFRRFQRQVVENFVLRDQFDAIRHEDPQRPILIYQIGDESDAFLRHIADGGGMMANGGVHSNFNTDHEYERMNAVPNLLFRMEPHDMWHYDPVANGFDEMIFGLLAMGGRGLGFHVFLPGWETFSYDKALQPGQTTGDDKLVKYAPMLQELRDAEKLHDPIGIMTLRNASTVGEPWEWTIWHIHCAIYALRHYSPLVAAPETRLSYLDGSRVIFLGGSVIDAAQARYIRSFLHRGGKVVMEEGAGQYSFDTPDSAAPHALRAALSIPAGTPAAQVPGLAAPHDLYTVGRGQTLVIHGHDLWNDKWEAMLPAILQWAGVGERLADSDDRYMQIHVLQRGPTYYMATTHRGSQQSGYEGPPSWTGKVRFCKPLPAGSYHLTEMMDGLDLGHFTLEQLAAGWDAGAYSELQMKIFKITPD